MADTTETNTQSTNPDNQASKAESILHNWRERLEELLKAKNLDELKTEFRKIGGEIQGEIQNFDLNEHLSPTAKARVKQLEKRYNEVLKTVQKAQKQFDREYSTAIKTMKSAQKDAEKRLEQMKKKLAQQKKEFTKAASKFSKNIKKKKTTRKKSAARKKTPTKKTTSAAKK